MRAGSGDLRYYHRTQQYSINALTDSDANVTERYVYTAYGIPRITDGAGATHATSANDNRYMYTGREWDENLSLYHYRARMYDSVIGRFLGRDPIGYVNGLSFYEYVSSSLLTYFDPSGLCQAQAEKKCICETELEKCTIQYDRFRGRWFVGKYLNSAGKLWFDHEAGRGFTATVVHSEGKNTCGCTIIQDVLVVENYLNDGVAKPKVADDFDKPADAAIYSTVAGNWVFTFVPEDYGPGDTQCVKRQAQINDSPRFKLKGPVTPIDKRHNFYGFFSTTRIQEAPSVTGTFFYTGRWWWDDEKQTVTTRWQYKSHDARLNSSGSFTNTLSPRAEAREPNF